MCPHFPYGSHSRKTALLLKPIYSGPTALAINLDKPVLAPINEADHHHARCYVCHLPLYLASLSSISLPASYPRYRK